MECFDFVRWQVEDNVGNQKFSAGLNFESQMKNLEPVAAGFQTEIQTGGSYESADWTL